MEKVALVLFVKDEADEIAWWIAWHLALGVNTILIYDDASSDGTSEIISAASKVLDVRCFQSPLALRFQQRQGQTYMKALDDFRQEFDWIGFLDADEYLDFQDADNIQDFLGLYNHANGVAINWCCYGSNNHIVKPGSNVLECYTKHSNETYPENRYVKSFVRPKQTSSEYINTHNYAVSGSYVLPDGSDIVWEKPHLQRSLAPPKWDRAMIRHYIIRSAEHYIEKVKRRSDIRTAGFTMDFFRHYDRNDVEERIKQSKLEKMYDSIYLIQHQVALDTLDAISTDFFTEFDIDTVRDYFKEYCREYTLKTHWGSALSTNTSTGLMGHAFLDHVTDVEIKPIVGFMIVGDEEHFFLTSTRCEVPIHASGDNRVSLVNAYNIIQIGDGKIALQCQNSKKILSFASIKSEEKETSGVAEANRDWAREWETLVPKSVSSSGPVSSKLNLISWAVINCLRKPLPKFKDGSDRDLVADALFAKLSTLSASQVMKWRLLNGIPEIPWLNINSRISY